MWSCLHKSRPDPLSGPHGKGSLWLHWVNLQGVWIFKAGFGNRHTSTFICKWVPSFGCGGKLHISFSKAVSAQDSLEFFWIPSDSVKIHAYFIRLTSLKILLSLLIWSGSECLFKIHIYWQICNYYRLKTNVSEALLKTLKAKVPMFWAVAIRAASDVTSLKKQGSGFQVGYKVSMLDKVPVLLGNLGFNTQSKQGNSKKIMSDTVSIWRQ